MFLGLSQDGMFSPSPCCQLADHIGDARLWGKLLPNVPTTKYCICFHVKSHGRTMIIIGPYLRYVQRMMRKCNYSSISVSENNVFKLSSEILLLTGHTVSINSSTSLDLLVGQKMSFSVDILHSFSGRKAKFGVQIHVHVEGTITYTCIHTHTHT